MTTPDNAVRSYHYHYVPTSELAAYLAGERRAAGMISAGPWDGSDVHGPNQYTILGVRVVDQCATCEGTGQKRYVQRTKRHFLRYSRAVKCPTCKGRDSIRDVTPTIAQ
jgi:hypothetical protein